MRVGDTVLYNDGSPAAQRGALKPAIVTRVHANGRADLVVFNGDFGEGEEGCARVEGAEQGSHPAQWQERQ